jgi:hypothetical protein
MILKSILLLTLLGILIAEEIKYAGYDRFGMAQIYPTADGGREWHVNMDDPCKDPLFSPKTKLTKKNGGWYVDDKEVRMNVLTHLSGANSTQWLNMEISGLLNHDGAIPGAPEHLPPHYAFYGRGGRHTACSGSSLICCDGSAYKGDIYPDGKTLVRKELWHEEYAKERDDQSHGFKMQGKWIGFKVVIYNDDKGHVNMETYYDESGSGKTWKLGSKTNDTGGWSASEKKGCKNPKTGAQRKADEVINWSGPIATFRSDYVKYTWKNLSVREVCPKSGCNDKDHFTGCQHMVEGNKPCSEHDCPHVIQ